MKGIKKIKKIYISSRIPSNIQYVHQSVYLSLQCKWTREILFKKTHAFNEIYMIAIFIIVVDFLYFN